MDFFEAQDRARSRTKTLVLLFAAAAIATGFAIYLVVSFALGYADETQQHAFWDPLRLALVVGATCGIMTLCSLFKIKSLSAGGSAVAAMLGGQRVSAQPSDPKLQQYRNVVEEMAIAAGCRVPEIFVLEKEESINAFAAGYTLDNAAIAVSRGCLEQLDREELQGVVAHEFSHILNGDMRLNTRLIGVIFGILVVAVIGRFALQIVGHGGGRSRSSDSKGNGGIAVVLIIAFAVMCIGYIGVLFGRLIQSAISRQREYLADAAAVQFTRNPSGIVNALRRIKSASSGSRIQHPDSEEVGHMFFASGLKSSFGGAFATHPPLDKRIKAIDPNGLYTKSTAPRRPAPAPPAPAAARRQGNFVEAIATDPMAGAAMTAVLLESLPRNAQSMAHDPQKAFDILASCLQPADTKLAGRSLRPPERFALIEFALAALKHLSQREIEGGLMRLETLAEKDHVIDFEERCLLLAVRRNLRDWHTNANGKLAHFPQVKKEVEVILSAVALADDPEGTDIAAAAFQRAQSTFNTFGAQAQPDFEAAQSHETVSAAIEKAATSIFAVRRALIEGAARIASHDSKLSDREQSMIRALCLALSCPLPQ